MWIDKGYSWQVKSHCWLAEPKTSWKKYWYCEYGEYQKQKNNIKQIDRLPNGSIQNFKPCLWQYYSAGINWVTHKNTNIERWYAM